MVGRHVPDHSPEAIQCYIDQQGGAVEQMGIYPVGHVPFEGRGNGGGREVGHGYNHKWVIGQSNAEIAVQCCVDGALRSARGAVPAGEELEGAFGKPAAFGGAEGEIDAQKADAGDNGQGNQPSAVFCCHSCVQLFITPRMPYMKPTTMPTQADIMA